MASEITQAEMAHKLPQASVVDRIDFLVELAAGKYVVHIGFVDSRCTEFHGQFDSWLHQFLSDSASKIVGLDLDASGVAAARTQGFEAFVADCTVPEQTERLELEPADMVVAGEVIEHLDNPGGLLEAAHGLVKPGGTLVLTTPNAHGLMNISAAIAGYEVNHPDHVSLYSAFTLTNMLANHDWEVTSVRTYVPDVKQIEGLGPKLKVLAVGARLVLRLERTLGRIGRPYSGDGLIVVARSRR